MHIDTSYAVRLFFSSPSFVQIYYEAVANALDAEADQIDITIASDGQVSSPKLSIEIADNGHGFTEQDFERFARLVEPKDPYHKGMGRLIYLHYFEKILVESRCAGKRRRFTFSRKFDGSSDHAEAKPGQSNGTILRFVDFIGSRIRSYDDLKPEALKPRLIEQFFPLLHQRKRENRPFIIRITVQLDQDNPQRQFFADTRTITIDDIPDLKRHEFHDDALDGFANISILHHVAHDASKSIQFTAASVDGRTIPLKLLKQGAVPQDCSAVFIVESQLFTGKSDSTRQRLTLSDGVSEQTLMRVLRDQIAKILNEEVPQIARRNEATRRDFEQSFPHLIGLFGQHTVGLINRDEAIEAAQRQFFRQQKEILDSHTLSDSVFEKSLEMSARSLTEYVLYRDFIVKKLTSISPEAREATIHNLIVPQHSNHSHTDLVDQAYRNNAWLLDDKFMTFRTILSEARMEEVIQAITLRDDVEDAARPDISMIFSADPDNEERVDVVVIELKRRKVADKEGSYAATQLVTRAQKLVDHCPNIQRVWYYGIIEIDDDMGLLLRNMKWAPLFSRDHVYYQEFRAHRSDGSSVPTPIFLLSFAAVTADAAARNHTFLEILRSGFKRAASNRCQTGVV